ncbi:MAG TPA: TRCF domain-containing protein, partial [Candidatus Polarisedimenticolia bacterium]|nr:TRCF domain-containing protein [Candidatus Polarisedimenticolia bacterium]
IRDEIRDLYGEIPRPAENLLALAEVRLMADRLQIRAIDHTAGRVQLRFAGDAPVDPQTVVRLASSRKGLSLQPSGALRLQLDEIGGPAGADRPAGDPWRITAVLDLLKSIRAGATMPAASQPTAVGPSTEDR